MKLVIALACMFFSATVFSDSAPFLQDDFLRTVKSQPHPNPWESGDFGNRVAAQGCCKTYTKGKACGDTCIARDKICHVGPGCACNG